MSKIAIITILLSISLITFGQEEKKKLTCKEKRALRKQQQKELSEQMGRVLTIAIDSQQWVLEANTLANKRGNSAPVNSALNFIAIEGDEAFVQLGSDTGMGLNGVGGVTVRGNITRYEVKKNKKKCTYYIEIYVSSSVGSFDIRIDSNCDGQIADATVQGNTSRRVEYRGIIVPLSESNVYKASPIN